MQLAVHAVAQRSNAPANLSHHHIQAGRYPGPRHERYGFIGHIPANSEGFRSQIQGHSNVVRLSSGLG